MGPHGAVVPSFRSILQSYGLCSGSGSAASLFMMPRYLWNSLGTWVVGSSPLLDTETYPMTWAAGSTATKPSQERENSLTL